MSEENKVSKFKKGDQVSIECVGDDNNGARCVVVRDYTAPWAYVRFGSAEMTVHEQYLRRYTIAHADLAAFLPEKQP